MITLALVLTLSCPEVFVSNASDEEWTKKDQQALEQAKVRCEQLWKDAPCLTAFLKKKDLTYFATCGEKK